MLDFFVFPRELRDLIYIQYAIVDGGYILNPHNNKLKRADERPVSFDLAFMLTCKLVAKEMKGVILAANTLTFSTFYSDGERLNACHFGRLMDNLDNHLIGKLYQWATTCYKDDIAETITNAYPQFKPLLDLIRDDPEFDGLWGLLSRRSCGETPSTYREFVRFALRAVAKRRRRFPKKFAKLSKNRSTHPKLPFKQLLKHIPEPWAIPTSEFVEEMKSIMDDEQHAHRDQDKNKKYHYSAAAVAIRFLRSLSREDRASVRSIVLNEDRAAVSNTECHALGLIPFCQENPHLRIERRVSMWRTAFQSRSDSLDHFPYPKTALCADDISYGVAVWIMEALALGPGGMPPGSFKLVFEGDSVCSEIFQTVMHRDAAWQMAIIESMKRESLPALSWGQMRQVCRYVRGDNESWFIFDEFPQAMRDIASGTSVVSCNFDSGTSWNVDRLIEKNGSWTMDQWRDGWSDRDKATFDANRPSQRWEKILHENYLGCTCKIGKLVCRTLKEPG